MARCVEGPERSTDCMNKLVQLYTQLVALLTEERDTISNATSVSMPAEQPIPSTAENPDTLLPWTTPENCHHNVRVVCDLEGLTYNQKQILTACVRQESDFVTTATHNNTNNTIDYGICQYNDGLNQHGVPYWIGEGATFPNPAYVINNPLDCVQVMCRYLKATGNLNPWVSYASGEYKQWLGKV